MLGREVVPWESGKANLKSLSSLSSSPIQSPSFISSQGDHTHLLFQPPSLCLWPQVQQASFPGEPPAKPAREASRPERQTASFIAPPLLFSNPATSSAPECLPWLLLTLIPRDQLGEGGKRIIMEGLVGETVKIKAI